MMSNAKQYNPAGSYAHNEAIALETYFEKRMRIGLLQRKTQLTKILEWTIINKTLEAAHAKEVQKQPPKQPPKALPPAPAPAPVPDPPVSAAPIASTSRPTIKLKAPAKEATPKLLPKPKRKHKVEVPAVELPVDPPPPPYVDDGSHDILQEVIALELEKVEKVRHRSSAVANGKRKKVDISTEESEEGEEDDLLALATPAKKGRPSPPEASSSAISKITVNPHKSKPPVEPPQSRPTNVDVPRISIKGKDKEVLPVVPPPRPKKSPVAQATPINEKKCKQLLTTLMKLEQSAIFLRPVDPERDGCPT
jgi:transcription initiation factor TFIID subunit 2